MLSKDKAARHLKRPNLLTEPELLKHLARRVRLHVNPTKVYA